MQIYLIEGKSESRLNLMKELGEKISKKSKTLILSFKRSKDVNIEDLFDMGGMIAYDICDYFLSYIELENLLIKVNEDLYFSIAPLLENKYELKKEDIKNILEKLKAFDYLVIDGLDKNMLEEKKVVEIIEEDRISENCDSDYFIIEAKDDFNPRLVRNEILGKSSKFIGIKNKIGTFDTLLDNLIEDRKADIEKLSFIEKIKLKFKK